MSEPLKSYIEDEQPVGNMPNATVVNKLHRMLDEMIQEMNRKGWYGEFTLTGRVQDGTIQGKSVEGKTPRTFIIE